MLGGAVRRILCAGLVPVFFLLFGESLPVFAQPVVVQRIEIIGNRRIPRETLKGRIFTREGDPYDEEVLRRDFQALWNTQYFEDIRLEVEDSPDRPNAKIILFYVTERPVIRRIEYCKLETGQSPGGECKEQSTVTNSEILDRFKERKVGLSVESQFDPTRVRRAEVILKELFSERGRQFATIRTTYQRIPATNAITLRFNIDQGPKVKVGEITFTGNEAFSDRRIIRSMRHSRPFRIPLYFFDLNLWSKTYDRRKLAEDMEIGVRGLYQDHGYFRVTVLDPETETVDVNRGGIPGPWPFIGRRRGKKTNINIPLEEGERYRMGRLVVRSADPDKPLSFRTDILEEGFPIKPGEIFAVDKIRKALEDYRKLYGNFGFIDFTAEPLTDVDDVAKVVNLTLEFREEKQFFVRRIEFSGNTTTRDKVIRREILLDEGDLFNRRYWELSLLRLNQLDYFEEIKEEHAELKRNLREGSIDILLKVKEKGRQSIGLTGGVSGIAGSFIGFNYQTNNFLGLGETLTFSAEFGDRQRNFIFSFTEPYLFDRPIASGFSIFSTRYSFDQARESSLLIGRRIELDPNSTQNFDQNTQGFTLFASYPLRRWSFLRIGATYSFTTTSISAFSDASRLLFESIQFRGVAGPSALRGIRSSKIVPTISYNTVNHPINPTSGKSFFVSTAVEGGPLQGNVNVVNAVFEGKYFRPINKGRNVLGFRLLSAFTTGYGGKVLPPFNRFYVGGEDSVRGFDIRTITPVAFIPTQRTGQIFFINPSVLDANGNPQFQLIQVPVLDYVISFPGGDSQVVSNVEYRIPIVGPVSMSLFLDAGLNGILRRNQLRLDPGGLSLLRQQFPATNISERLDLAPGTNFKLHSSAGVEFVVQLPVLNAPFRLYWAYNLSRLRSTLQEPTGDFFLDSQLRQTLPPGILQAQILPQLNATVAGQAQRINFFEPLKTFRFTVSRTF